jgi:hypothetical protein
MADEWLIVQGRCHHWQRPFSEITYAVMAAMSFDGMISP